MSDQQIAMVKAKDVRDQKAFIDRSNATRASVNDEARVTAGCVPIVSKGLLAYVRSWLGI